MKKQKIGVFSYCLRCYPEYYIIADSVLKNTLCPLKDDEIERIKLACAGNKRNIAIVTFFLETGVRVTELCNIKLCDIDFINHRCKVTGKGNKERIVYFTGKSYVMLHEYLKTRTDINLESIIYSGYNDVP